jgi:hypothetical protein
MFTDKAVGLSSKNGDFLVVISMKGRARRDAFVGEHAALRGTLDVCIDKCPLYLGVRDSEPDVRLRVCDLTDYANNTLTVVLC